MLLHQFDDTDDARLTWRGGGSAMLVYRIETKGGQGPYQAGCYGLSDNYVQDALGDDLRDAHQGSLAHPGPGQDGINPGRLASGYYFGFASERDLVAWFDGWADRLHDAGYVISTYRVADVDVMKGRRQVAFRRRLAVHLGTRPVHTLLTVDEDIAGTTPTRDRRAVDSESGTREREPKARNVFDPEPADRAAYDALAADLVLSVKPIKIPPDTALVFRSATTKEAAID